LKGITHLKRLPCPWEVQNENGRGGHIFLSHAYETQEICCFLADVQIILVSLFEFFDYIKVAKNAGAFLSRCSELLEQM